MQRFPPLGVNVPREVVIAKAYYGERLLRLGPLTYGQFREITDWSAEECEAVLRHMRKARVADHINGKWKLLDGLRSGKARAARPPRADGADARRKGTRMVSGERFSSDAPRVLWRHADIAGAEDGRACE
jgi:hypothetical protein